MRVAIDARSVEPKMQGVGRYVLNLLLGLSHQESDLEFLVLYNNPMPRKLVERAGGPVRNRFQWIKSLTRHSSGLSGILEGAEMPWLLKIHNADLFHDVAAAGLWTANTPTVVTVHELASLHFKESKDQSHLRRVFRQASLIIAVSESIADEIESNFNISRPKIRVISNAIDPWYNDRVAETEIRGMRDRFKLSGRYFLCVTASRPSKNTSLVEQVAQEWSGNEEWVFTLPEAAVPAGKRLGSRYLGVVEDVWLRPLYAASVALVVPSLYEGFSLPPIEALATGTIPVVSNIAAHRELVGEILPQDLFFDPASRESLEKALNAVLAGGDPLRASVLEKFRQVAHRYSFKETAFQTQAVYREALKL